MTVRELIIILAKSDNLNNQVFIRTKKHLYSGLEKDNCVRPLGEEDCDDFNLFSQDGLVIDLRETF